MPGKWGGACWACPPRSANELGCQANGGRAPGAPPLDPPMFLYVKGIRPVWIISLYTI